MDFLKWPIRIAGIFVLGLFFINLFLIYSETRTAIDATLTFRVDATNAQNLVVAQANSATQTAVVVETATAEAEVEAAVRATASALTAEANANSAAATAVAASVTASAAIEETRIVEATVSATRFAPFATATHAIELTLEEATLQALTPTATLMPTITWTPSPTFTVTPTPTLVPSNTPPPTDTPIPTCMATISGSTSGYEMPTTQSRQIAPIPANSVLKVLDGSATDNHFGWVFANFQGRDLWVPTGNIAQTDPTCIGKRVINLAEYYGTLRGADTLSPLINDNFGIINAAWTISGGVGSVSNQQLPDYPNVRSLYIDSPNGEVSVQEANSRQIRVSDTKVAMAFSFVRSGSDSYAGIQVRVSDDATSYYEVRVYTRCAVDVLHASGGQPAQSMFGKQRIAVQPEFCGNDDNQPDFLEVNVQNNVLTVTLNGRSVTSVNTDAAAGSVRLVAGQTRAYIPFVVSLGRIQ